MIRSLCFVCVLPVLAALTAQAGKIVSLLNVSYDPTREFYQEIDAAFVKSWKEKTGDDLTIHVSNGGSGKQARAVIEGDEADVVTLAVASDIDALHDRAGLLPANWQQRLPSNSCPYSSTIVFLERRGGRVHVHDWDDLARPGVSVIVPNPKTSGGARWIYLAAYGWALQKNHGDNQAARRFVEQLYRNVPVMDEGARGAATTFVQRGIGDVFIGWENDALLVVNGIGRGHFDIEYPPESIRTEPPVAVVDKYADEHGTRVVAEAYLQFLYTEPAQEIGARNFYRPQLQAAFEKYKTQFPQIQLFTITEVAGNWKEVQAKHFADHGVFDQIYKP